MSWLKKFFRSQSLQSSQEPTEVRYFELIKDIIIIIIVIFFSILIKKNITRSTSITT